VTFKVMREPCSQCLYSPDKIVSNARRSEILRKVRHDDGFFVCHKSQIAGDEACCAGDFKAHGGGQLGRIAGRLNVIEFVAAATYEDSTP
jgi:hypothetical protein